MEKKQKKQTNKQTNAYHQLLIEEIYTLQVNTM